MMDDKLVSMQVWDTAGQEKYQSVQGIYYRGADACILVCDLTNPDSFVALTRWKEEFLRMAGILDPQSFPFVLLGNKSDILAERKVGPRATLGLHHKARRVVQEEWRHAFLRDLG